MKILRSLMCAGFHDRRISDDDWKSGTARYHCIFCKKSWPLKGQTLATFIKLNPARQMRSE